MARSVDGRTSLAEVLRAELVSIRGWDLPEPPRSPHDREALKELHRTIARPPDGAPLSALCLSGGGIRSATFNLGVLQGLARAGVLASFDYVSTVSGGGYVGSWLQAWIARERERGERDPVRKVLDALCRPGRTPAEIASEAPGGVLDPLEPEPKPVDRLREFSNYLTPRKGLFSGDTWAVASTVARNLLLNWLVIVPVIAAALMIPQAAYVIAASRGYGAIFGGAWVTAASWAALLIGFVSSVATNWMRTERRGKEFDPDRARRAGERRREQGRRQAFVLATAGAAFLAAALFVLATLWAHEPREAIPGLGPWHEQPGLWGRALRALTWTVGLPVAGAAVARFGRFLLAGERLPWKAIAWELVALLVSGGLAALALAWLIDEPWRAMQARPQLFTVVALPILLVLYVLARALFVALVSRVEDTAPGTLGDDAEREWWARMTGRLLTAAAGWAALSGIVLLGTWVLADNWREAYESLSRVRSWIAAVGGAAGAVAGFLGKSGETSSGRAGGAQASGKKELVLALAAPVAVVCVLILVAAGTAWLGRAVNNIENECFLLVPPLDECTAEESNGMELLRFLGVAGALALLGWGAGWFVNVNRFSLHALYRNRLARAFLGASNPDRRPNPITGFDPEDSGLHLASLRAADGHARLFPIVNVTLNLLRDERLAVQERQAESFSMTPLFCGNFYEGYRPTESYGGPGGVTLATAMAVSGAAANPNMGYVSSPPLTFLMGLLNARLGIWLANPNDNGDAVVSSPGPRHATWHLLREMLGETTRYSRYVNLSDGGHFDNLGLYEVVLRRCRLVVVSDAGCDPRSGFGDLGSAIRKIRIDFGIPIRFQKEIRLRPRKEDGELPGEGLHCAVGEICYEAADGAGAPPGTLIYLKPTLAPFAGETVPYDVQAYASASTAFPHESTVDQWFSESQFESYRALGAYLVGALAGEEPLPDLAAFEKRVRDHAGVPGVEPSAPGRVEAGGQGSGGARESTIHGRHSP